ncbi:MAG TPA: Ig-like domain-containing protein [Candidatus Eisenbacteria bacterium]|nr:Ig-like domain-containing protein [Candidatus Eisenbacteria bacterium]
MRHRRALAVLACAVAAGAMAGCARSVFPPGGPLDTIAPKIIAVTPADSTVHVARDAGVELMFSESMDHATVRDGIRVYPPPGRPRLDWSGRRVRVTWDEPLAESTTYVLLVSGQARDERGVPMGRPITVRFSTGGSLDSGRISGVLRTHTLVKRGVPILAFDESLGEHPDSSDALPSYATETDTAGVYELTALPVGRGFRILAWFDINTNGSIEPGTDLVSFYPDPVRLTRERARADSINIVAIDRRAPAVLNGRIASRDSTSKYRIEAQDTEDSSLVIRVERTGPGPFTLRVSAGTYRLRAASLPPPDSPEEPVWITREEPIVTKPEEEYGPFEFAFGTVEETPPPPEGGE